MSANPNPDPPQPDTTVLVGDRFGVNLRELVTLLDCLKDPHTSENLVMVTDRETGKLYSLKAIRVEPESDTVWLQVEEY